MKKSYIFIFIFSIILSSCGLPGFRTKDKDKIFHTTLNETFPDKKIDKIGVFVYSNGSAIEGLPKSDFKGFRFLYQSGFGYSLAKTPEDLTIDRYDFPTKISNESVFNPDSSNSGPSSELASKVVNVLNDKGYSSKEILDLGHNNKIKCEEILARASKLGLDAVFVVYYTGIKKWYKFKGVDVAYGYQSKTIISKIDSYSGFLYLPNAALISTKTGEILWSTQYYGLIQNAHYWNFSGQYFNQVAMDGLYEYGGDSYIEAAAKAADMIFKPKYWKKSFIEFPGSTLKKMKI